MSKNRLFDILLATIGLVVLSPAFIIISVLIRWSSPGGALFIQDRVGKDETVFKCIKFRTMTKNAPNVASHEADQDWITPIGRVLRKTKLDELPQLLNVLRGEMSLVGPRPCLPSQIELINARRSFDVFSMLPGVTGIAQVQKVDMSEPWKLAELDALYLAQSDPSTYWTIIYRTLVGDGSGDVVKHKAQYISIRKTEK